MSFVESHRKSVVLRHLSRLKRETAPILLGFVDGKYCTIKSVQVVFRKSTPEAVLQLDEATKRRRSYVGNGRTCGSRDAEESDGFVQRVICNSEGLYQR